MLKSIMEGYSFGAERAQVRTINDNDHIIPLYSYGVGTYDFDLQKVKGNLNHIRHIRGT